MEYLVLQHPRRDIYSFLSLSSVWFRIYLSFKKFQQKWPISNYELSTSIIISALQKIIVKKCALKELYKKLKEVSHECDKETNRRNGNIIFWSLVNLLRGKKPCDFKVTQKHWTQCKHSWIRSSRMTLPPRTYSTVTVSNSNYSSLKLRPRWKRWWCRWTMIHIDRYIDVRQTD